MSDEPEALMSRRAMVRTVGAGAFAAALGIAVSHPQRVLATELGSETSPSFVLRPEERAVFFDVGGTILDWSVMPEKLTNFFLERGLRVDGVEFWPAWRTKLFFYMMYNSLIDSGFIPLEELGRRTTLAVTGAMGIDLDRADAGDILPLLGELDLYPDVLPGLERMQEAGFRMIPHTQLSQNIVERALLHRFDWDWYFTSETFAVYKPHRSIYLRAFEALGLDPSQVIYVTSNQFDVFGAKGAGVRAAWVDRWDEPLEPYGYVPDWQVGNFEELADLIATGER